MNEKTLNYKNLDFSKFFSLAKKALPYFLLLIASILPFSIYFANEGITGGDDSYWHLIYNYDIIYGYRHGFDGITPNHLFLGTLGYDTFLFYAPFPHYFSAFLTMCFSFAGATIPKTFKFMAIASTYFSGIITYKLAKKITKDDNLSLIAGIAYIFFPYRIFNFLYRAAFCEGVALGFVPLLFYGVYSLLHDEEFHFSSYLAAILGVSLLVLSHPFTALTSVVACIFIILADFKLLIKFLKKKINIVFLCLSILLIFGLISFYLFPMASSLKSGYYRMSDSKAVWTDLNSVINSIGKSSSFSGFLNFPWLDLIVDKYHWRTTTDSKLSWSLEILLFLLFSIISIFILYVGRKKNKRKLGLSLSIVSSLIPLFFSPRIEVCLATVLFIVVLIFFENQNDSFLNENIDLRKEINKSIKNPEIYILTALLIVAFLYLYWDKIWEISPSIFRNCQFPFRFWGIFGFLSISLITILSKPFKNKKIFKESMLALSCLLFILNMGPVDKRIAYENGSGFTSAVDDDFVKKTKKVGVMNEYMPRVFYDDNYESEYSNSLYYSTKMMVRYSHKYNWDIDGYRYAFLEGSGDFKVTYLNSPELKFVVTVNEDALIQLQQFYYDGYEVILNSNGQSIKITPQYLDGLLSFSIPKGEYEGELKYVGSLSYRIARPFLYASIGILFALGVTCDEISKNKKIKERYFSSFSSYKNI